MDTPQSPAQARVVGLVLKALHFISVLSVLLLQARAPLNCLGSSKSCPDINTCYATSTNLPKFSVMSVLCNVLQMRLLLVTL